MKGERRECVYANLCWSGVPRRQCGGRAAFRRVVEPYMWGEIG